jgi:hypothetical protein
MGMTLEAIKRRVKEHGIPVSYANDNFGRWRSDFRKLIDYCSRKRAAVKSWFQLKSGAKALGIFSNQPRNSARVSRRLKSYSHGIAADICVLFSANDA